MDFYQNTKIIFLIRTNYKNIGFTKKLIVIVLIQELISLIK